MIEDLKGDESWRMFRIISEFTEGFEELSDIGFAVTIFGSARTKPDNIYYQKAEQIAQRLAEEEFAIISGGGPGIMEAANRGAFDVGCKSIGLNIKLPAEQQPNPFITPELCFQFKYFALRKFHFILRSVGAVLFPGGFGTLDEMFQTLTLRQTHRMQPIPIILFGHDYWSKVIDFDFLADSGVISHEHLDLFEYADTPESAWEKILRFNKALKNNSTEEMAPDGVQNE